MAQNNSFAFLPAQNAPVPGGLGTFLPDQTKLTRDFKRSSEDRAAAIGTPAPEDQSNTNLLAAEALGRF